MLMLSLLKIYKENNELLPLCLDVFIDSFQVIIIFKLWQSIYRLHSKYMLKHFLSDVKESEFETITEVQWFRQDPKEFRLLKAHG